MPESLSPEDFHQRVCYAPRYWLTRVVDELRPRTAPLPVMLDWPSIFDQLSPKGVAKPFTRQELFGWLHHSLKQLDAQAAPDIPPGELWEEPAMKALLDFSYSLRNAELVGDIPVGLREAKRIADMDIGAGSTSEEFIREQQESWERTRERRSKTREYAKEQISRIIDQVRAERSILFEAEIDGQRVIASYWRREEQETQAAEASAGSESEAIEESPTAEAGIAGAADKPEPPAFVLEYEAARMNKIRTNWSGKSPPPKQAEAAWHSYNHIEEIKGNTEQAKELCRAAGYHTKDDQEWRSRIKEGRRRLAGRPNASPPRPGALCGFCTEAENSTMSTASTA